VADSGGQRTEKPTPRRLEKARREGNFPSSREFVSAVHFLGFVALLSTLGGAWLMHTRNLMRTLLASAFRVDLSAQNLVAIAWDVLAPHFVPLILAGGGLVALMTGAQLASTRLGFAPSKLAPDFKRFNFFSRLSSLPGQNLPVFVQALLLIPIAGLVIYYEVTENLGRLLELPWVAPPAAIDRVGGVLETLLWRSAAVFLVVGVIDLFWQRSRYNKQLRMSKQEIREESKEQEGNPQTKMRIRRIQRDLARRQMMKEIPTATAVIVNPTHYAVAIRYSLADDGSPASGAPRVVAKGKNYLALRIRKRALEHQVPIVENPPLARALYTSVDVGQEIPSHLYRAVAEILAYIYRLMNGRLPG
jgi:flagellar biosynthesis protein FlhB